MVAHMPPDISYGLECATECFDITSDVITYYHLFNEAPITQMMDDFEHHRSTDVDERLHGYSRLYNRLYNNWFWTQARHHERVWCLSKATESFGRKSAELIECVWTRFISDCLARKLDPSSRTLQQSWLDRHRDMTHASKIVAQLARKMRQVSPHEVVDAIRRPAVYYDRLRIPQAQPFVIDRNDGRLVDPAMVVITTPVVKTIERSKRSVLKRSSALLSRIIGSKDTSLFIGGKEVRVTGQRFIFSVHKKSILSENWHALSIAVYDKANDSHLFNLCWYVDSTPAMDQLSALALAVKCGDEDSIIKIGNIMLANHDAIEQNEYLLNLLKERFNAQGDNPFAFDPLNGPGPDRLMHQTVGTQEYFLSHPKEYIEFHQRCVKRLMKKHFAPELFDYFRIHDPHTLRPFVGGRILPQLIDEQYRTLNVTDMPRLPIAA